MYESNDERRRAPAACAILLAAMALAGCAAHGSAGTRAPRNDDVRVLAEIQRTVDLLYETSSFRDAATADPEDFRRSFTPTARLAFPRNGEIVERTVDEYVESRRALFASGEIRSLQEWELGGRTELFGNIAHRMSTYGVRIDGGEEVVERGVMSIQMMRTAEGWRVHSLTWQAESETLPLPSF